MPRSHAVASSRAAARVGGWSLIAAAILFMAVFGYLAGTFGYPDVLELPADQVLPRLLALGVNGRVVWALYGILPMLLIPAGLGAYAALGRHAPYLMRAAAGFAALAGFAMMLGLLRWPSIHWQLATAYTSSTDPSQQRAIADLFDGLNSLLGNYIGEFVGELALNLFFLLTALGARGAPGFPRWSVPAGVVVATSGFIGMWRNVTPAVQWASEITNLLLPLWLIVLGVLLLRSQLPETMTGQAG